MLLQTDPIEYVEDICENMQLFSKEDFLTGDQLMFEFNPEVVAHHMQHWFWFITGFEKYGYTFVWKHSNCDIFFS